MNIKNILTSINKFFIDHTSEVFRKALKEFLRIGLIAGIGVITEGIVSGSLDLKLIVGASALAIIKAVDKYLHEQGILTDNASLTLGLTRF